MARPNPIIITNNMHISILHKKLVLLILSLALVGPLLAQYAMTGTVSDEQGETLGYATVALLNPMDSI